MAKKDSGGKKKDAKGEVHADADGTDAPSGLNGHALEQSTGPSAVSSPVPEPPALPAVGVEPQALPPVDVEPLEPIEPPLAEVRATPTPTPTPAPVPPPAPPLPTPAPLAPAPSVPSAAPAPAGWSSADVADAALVPLQVARSVLPTSRTSVVLGVVALGLVGVLDWPAAVGLGLGWEALRRWGPEAPRR